MNGGGQVVDEGQPADLVTDHGGRDPLRRQALHGPHEVLALARDPRRPDDVVPGDEACRHVSGGLRRSVGAERREGRVLGDGPRRPPIEDVLARDVDQRQSVVVRSTGEVCDAGRVGAPCCNAPIRGFGGVHGGEGRCVDNGVEPKPVDGGNGLPVADVDVATAECGRVGQQRGQGTSDLTVRAEDGCLHDCLREHCPMIIDRVRVQRRPCTIQAPPGTMSRLSPGVDHRSADQRVRRPEELVNEPDGGRPWCVSLSPAALGSSGRPTCGP